MAARPARRMLSLHQLYGITLETDVAFANRLIPGTGEPQLRFQRHPRPPQGPALPGRRHLGDHPTRVDGQPYSQLFAFDGGHLLSFPTVADFVLRAESIDVYVDERLDDGLSETVVELRFLGPVMALWLELRETLALHASAVVVDGAAIGFLSHGKGGKTSVAAALLGQGHPLLTDDLLAVTVDGEATGHPGFATMRMWPAEAEFFVGGAEQLPIVHPFYDKRRVPVGGPDGALGAFEHQARPLRALYVLERALDEIGPWFEVSPLSAGEALPHLLRHSTAPYLTTSGLAPERFRRLVELLRVVPVRHVLHATPREDLQALASALAADASALCSRSAVRS